MENNSIKPMSPILIINLLELGTSFYRLDTVGIIVFLMIIVFDILFLKDLHLPIQGNRKQKRKRLAIIGSILSVITIFLLWVLPFPKTTNDFLHFYYFGAFRWDGIIVLLCSLIYYLKHLKIAEEKEEKTNWFYENKDKKE